MPLETDSKNPGIDKKRHMFDDPKNVTRVLYGLYTLCALSVLAEVVINRHHDYDHPWEITPLFYAIYGFVACVVLVLAATQMRKLIMRGEDYYDG